MDFLVTKEFVDSYEGLHDEDAALVDETIQRLLRDHRSGWARQGRIEGETRSAWLIPLRSRSLDIALYWDYLASDDLILYAVVVT